MSNKIVFVSTNIMFSGSEILLIKTAVPLSRLLDVYVYTKYQCNNLQNDETNNINFYNFSQKNTYVNKIKNRLLRKTYDLKLNLLKIKPSLVVISQGGPMDSLVEMEICMQLELKYIVINQLVSSYHWTQFSDSLLIRFQNAYLKAQSVYFVSILNEKLFKVFFGENFISIQINNPISLKHHEYVSYPDTSTYKIAFVGRIEFFHKGLDLLIEVLRNPVWATRNIEFNFYGSGPHEKILLEIIKRYELKFCFFKKHTNDLVGLWSQNHIGVLPSRFEGKSLAITEAMSLGRGVIATNVGGVLEQIEDGASGFVCENFTIESLTETLERAWENRFNWEKIGVNAREKFLKDNTVTPEEILVNHIKSLI